jgi:hypothetical protein
MIEFVERTVIEGGVETTTLQATTPRAVAWLEMHGADAVVARANLLATPGARVEHLFQFLLEQDLGPTRI